MSKILHMITDRVTTKKGMWITLGVWIIVAAVLAVFAPNSKDYQVSSVDALPDHMESVIAQQKVDKYFAENEGIPALLVFQAETDIVELAELIDILDQIEVANIHGVQEVIPLEK